MKSQKDSCSGSCSLPNANKTKDKQKKVREEFSSTQERNPMIDLFKKPTDQSLLCQFLPSRLKKNPRGVTIPLPRTKAT
jgi:hypothetical protein